MAMTCFCGEKEEERQSSLRAPENPATKPPMGRPAVRYRAQATKPPLPPGWSNCLFEQGNTASCKSVTFQKPSMFQATLRVFHVLVQKVRNISRIFLSKKFKLKYVIEALVRVSLQLKQKNKNKNLTTNETSNVVVGDHCILELQRCTTHSVPEQTVSWESPERCQVLCKSWIFRVNIWGHPQELV